MVTSIKSLNKSPGYLPAGPRSPSPIEITELQGQVRPPYSRGLHNYLYYFGRFRIMNLVFLYTKTLF